MERVREATLRDGPPRGHERLRAHLPTEQRRAQLRRDGVHPSVQVAVELLEVDPGRRELVRLRLDGDLAVACPDAGQGTLGCLASDNSYIGKGLGGPGK